MFLIIRIVCDILPLTLFGSLLRSMRFQTLVSNTNFCIVEKTFHLLYLFSGAHLGTRDAGLMSAPVFTNFSTCYYCFASRVTSLGLLRSVLLPIESLLLVGDDLTIFQ